MKIQHLVLTVLTVWYCPLTAGAAPHRPPVDCGIDADADGWCVSDASRTMVDPADATKTVAFLRGAVDCNDGDKAVNPGATEKIGDGIDNDCDSDTDDEAPPAFARAFCGARPSAVCVNVMEAEIEACEADASACAVNKSVGKFLTSFGWYFLDKDCNGERELVNQSDYDEWLAQKRDDMHDSKWEPRKDGRCGARRHGVTSTKPVTDPALLARVGKVEETVAVHEEAIRGLGGRTDQLETDLTASIGRIDGLDTALETETAQRIAEDAKHDAAIKKIKTSARKVKGRVAKVEVTATTALNAANGADAKADLALSRGVEGGVSVGYLNKIQRPIAFRGETLRGETAHAFLIRGHLGIERPSLILRGIGGVGLVNDEDGRSENGGLLLLAGAELLFKLNQEDRVVLGVGGFGHDSGTNAISRSAASRSAYGEVGFEWSPDRSSGFRTPVRLSIIGGGEQLGTRVTVRGSNGHFEATGSGLFAGLTFTVGAGMGPSNHDDSDDESDD